MTKIHDWSSIKTHATTKDTLIEITNAIIGFLLLLMFVGMSGVVLYLLK